MSEVVSKPGALDVERLRAEFPTLAREVRPGVRLVYLDSAATSQKPRRVIEAIARFYEQQNANVHRGIYALSEEATAAYEGAREKVARFIGATSPKEIVFTRNTTEAINLVAWSWGRANLQPGDLVVLTQMEHHSNLVPWYMLAGERDLRLAHVPLTEDGRLDLEAYQDLLEQRPRLVAFTQMSNVLGTINPVAEMTRLAHEAGAVVLVDGAQSVPHLPVDVAALEVDFLAFSGHKMCGPTGVGVLYGKRELLEAMPPFLGGGDMIKKVWLGGFQTNEVPYKFEAGTPAIAEAVGLGEAAAFLTEVGLAAIHAHEQALVGYALERLSEMPGVRVLGPAAEHKGGVAAFTLDGVHAHDVAQILDQYGVAVRAGHHCAMPLHERYGVTATSRASLYLYNTREDVDALIEALYRVKDAFGV